MKHLVAIFAFAIYVQFAVSLPVMPDNNPDVESLLDNNDADPGLLYRLKEKIRPKRCNAEYFGNGVDVGAGVGEGLGLFLGAIFGQMLIPIPGLGAALGTSAGALFGPSVGAIAGGAIGCAF